MYFYTYVSIGNVTTNISVINLYHMLDYNPRRINLVYIVQVYYFKVDDKI